MKHPSHVLWKSSDPGAPIQVTEWGLGVCKLCGDFEAGLDNPCQKNIARFTCDKCPEKTTCDLAFDPYNTDGDCLAIK